MTYFNKMLMNELMGCYGAMNRMADARDALDRLKKLWVFSDEDRAQLDKVIEMIQNHIIEVNSNMEKVLDTEGVVNYDEYEKLSKVLRGEEKE